MKKVIALLFVLAAFLGLQVVSFATSYGEKCPVCEKDDWTYKDPIKAATCTEDGYKGFVCNTGAGCGYIKVTETIPATGHSYDQADCSNQRICTICNEPNPKALTSFKGNIGYTQLYVYDLPSSTTFTPIPSHEISDGHIVYTLSRSGIVRFGSSDATTLNLGLSTPIEINAYAAGNVTLTVQVYDGCGYFTTEQIGITVKDQITSTVESVVVQPDNLSLIIGETSTALTYVLPNTADQTVLYAVDNPSVVDTKEVTGGIEIQGKNTGDTIIRVYSPSLPSEPAIITVHVAPTLDQPSPTPTSAPTPTPTWSPTGYYTITYAPGYYSTGTATTSPALSSLVHLQGRLFTRTGYTQTGWSLDPSGSTLNYSLNAEYPCYSDVTFYPYWTVNPSAPLKLYITYNSSLGTVYFNGKVFPSNHYWSINPGETLNFSFVPISNYYASYIKLAGRYLGIYNNAFSVSYDDMRASDQTATVSFVSIYSHPKTGDTGNAALWAMLGMISLTGLTIVALRNRKRG